MTTSGARSDADQQTHSDQFALFEIRPGGASAKTSHRPGSDRSANHQDDSKEHDRV
jgi:hypothetical protein